MDLNLLHALPHITLLMFAQILTVLTSIACSWLMAHQRIEAFYVGTVGNVIYIVINLYLGTYVIILSYLVFTFMNFYAISTWKKMHQQKICNCSHCGSPINKDGEVVSD